GQYNTIDDYNREAGEVREPYRILVVLNYPTKFSPDAAERLASIASSGARCGIYTIVLADLDLLGTSDKRQQFHLAELERHSTVFAAAAERFVWDDDDLQH